MYTASTLRKDLFYGGNTIVALLLLLLLLLLLFNIHVHSFKGVLPTVVRRCE
jgi:hypothetical protein